MSGRPPRERAGSWARLLLAHHGPEEAHHCYRLPFGKEGVLVCARCAGLYPVLFGLVTLEGWRYPLIAAGRWLAAFALITPAVIDWSRTRLFDVPGRNGVRSLTGALAGLGLGLALGDYLRFGMRGYVGVLLSTLVGVVLLVWACSGRGPFGEE